MNQQEIASHDAAVQIIYMSPLGKTAICHGRLQPDQYEARDGLGLEPRQRDIHICAHPKQYNDKPRTTGLPLSFVIRLVTFCLSSQSGSSWSLKVRVFISLSLLCCKSHSATVVIGNLHSSTLSEVGLVSVCPKQE